MAFGTWIRARREEAGIMLIDFARDINISPAYWSRIERGLEKAPKDQLIISACERAPGCSCRARQPTPGVPLKPPRTALPVLAVPARRAL